MTKKIESPEPKSSEKVDFKDKMKSSYYLDKKSEERLMELYIQRIKAGQRPRKSQLVDEAILCLYEREIGKKD